MQNINPQLIDNYGRIMSYVRLAVTDRCNLRCKYCMPQENMNFVGKNQLLSYEEMIRVVSLLAQMGVNKVRVTGGEPMIRKGMTDFLQNLGSITGLDSIHLTTNATATNGKEANLKKWGIKDINVSLDTIDPQKYALLTGRDMLDKVLDSINQMIKYKIKIKINAVASEYMDEQDFEQLVYWAIDKNLTLRFIEKMPFDGHDNPNAIGWNSQKIKLQLHKTLGNIYPIERPPHSTSLDYSVPNHIGKVGIIEAASRTFCGDCNRLRITPTGELKTCLYGDAVFNLRNFIRDGASNEQLKFLINEAVSDKAKNGFEAEARQKNGFLSMSQIGG